MPLHGFQICSMLFIFKNRVLNSNTNFFATTPYMLILLKRYNSRALRCCSNFYTTVLMFYLHRSYADVTHSVLLFWVGEMCVANGKQCSRDANFIHGRKMHCQCIFYFIGTFFLMFPYTLGRIIGKV